ILRIDELEIDTRPDTQPIPLEPDVDNIRATDEDRRRNAFFQNDLGSAQYAFVFPIGIDNAFGLCAFGYREDRFHDETGAEDEAVQLVDICFEIFDGTSSNTASACSPGHRRRYAQDQPRVEW